MVVGIILAPRERQGRLEIRVIVVDFADHLEGMIVIGHDGTIVNGIGIHIDGRVNYKLDLALILQDEAAHRRGKGRVLGHEDAGLDNVFGQYFDLQHDKNVLFVLVIVRIRIFLIEQITRPETLELHQVLYIGGRHSLVQGKGHGAWNGFRFRGDKTVHVECRETSVLRPRALEMLSILAQLGLVHTMNRFKVETKFLRIGIVARCRGRQLSRGKKVRSISKNTFIPCKSI